MSNEQIADFLKETVLEFEAEIDNDLSDMEKFELTKEDLLALCIKLLVEHHQGESVSSTGRLC